MRKIIIVFLLIIISAIAFVLLSSSALHKTIKGVDDSKRLIKNIPFRLSKKLQDKALNAKLIAKKNNYNANFCFLIDMSLASGKNRFFIYDIEKDSVIQSALVAHGSCNTNYLDKVLFSNDAGCGCSSKGLYKIGYRYSGRFGKSYKLYGLDSSNSNAFSRAIVLHSYAEVPDHEIYPDVICNSLGCPMVSYKFLEAVSKIIDQSKKPVLLWIFN